MALMNGYMKIKLAGAESQNDFLRQTEFTEDWSVKQKRIQLFKKPRMFTINIYLLNKQGEKALDSIKINQKVTKAELANVIFDRAISMVNENSDIDIDLYQSYAVIRA